MPSELVGEDDGLVGVPDGDVGGPDRLVVVGD